SSNFGSGGTNTGAAYVLPLDPCPQIIASPIAYDSPNDDGVYLCVPSELPASGAHTLHVYVQSGPTATANPSDTCVEDLGEGNEMCAWDVRVSASGGASITGFAANGPSGTPPAGQGVVSPPPGMDWELVSPAEFRANWLGPATPSDPTAGPVKIGDLSVSLDGSPDAEVRIATGSRAVGAALQLQQIPDRPIAVPLPEPGPTVGLLAGAALLSGIGRRRRRAAQMLPVLVILAAGGGEARAAISIEGQSNIYFGNAGFSAGASSFSHFGRSVAVAGDIDRDGVLDIAVGRRRRGNTGPGTAFLLFMRQNGTVAGWQEYPGTGVSEDGFGNSIISVLDLDGNGTEDLAVGADELVSGSAGSVSILFLDSDGVELSRLALDESDAPLADLDVGDRFGASLAYLGDIDNDGNPELAVGAPQDDDVSTDAGTVWILDLASPTGDVAAAQRLGPLAGSLDPGDRFGSSIALLGDLDGTGPSAFALAVGAMRDDDGDPGLPSPDPDNGAVYILFLDSSFNVLSQQKLSATVGGVPWDYATLEKFGGALAWQDNPEADGGVLYVGTSIEDPSSGAVFRDRVWSLSIGSDGAARGGYTICRTCGYGFTTSSSIEDDEFGFGIAVLPDLDGDEDPDLLVGAPRAQFIGSNAEHGAVFVLFTADHDHDGFDENLDNCPAVHNPLQDDVDGDGVGDLCDNCVDVANASQDDADVDGEGDACEPVELQLQTTGTPAAPAWNLRLQCGAYSVTDVAAAIVLPAGSTAPQTLVLNGASVGTSSTSGPGLSAPQRSDAIYFTASGNGGVGGDELCQALATSVSLGTLTTGAIGGTQLAAAALTAEGVTANLAEDAAGAVPLSDIRLVNGIPLPILDLELGPAVQTQAGTRWEVRIKNASSEFHRVAFGLIAPAGTTTGQMRWRGCDTTPNGASERVCCESPPCGDFDGVGVGTNVNPNRSWTVGPQASPSGTQLPDTLYVVLEGTALSNGTLDTLNPSSEGQFHVLGEVELT
ncbi:MAG: FG-GAP repeat protein, partial [Deltaproteobacteria bacterium]|nr:FG-GAP repeat protein [Deltaproteobacteria bacterium]MBW2535115.1 FG-GAP repeat protein [Deltaproteobacteria bacterium]